MPWVVDWATGSLVTPFEKRARGLTLIEERQVRAMSAGHAPSGGTAAARDGLDLAGPRPGTGRQLRSRMAPVLDARPSSVPSEPARGGR